MTVLEVLQSTTGYFAQKGIEHPRLNIEHLLADALGKKRIDVYLEFDRSLSEAELKPLRDKVRRRGEGEPLQHVLGYWDFFGRKFKTDRRALVPRPETERLAEALLKEMGPGDGAGQLLDVGTGSGILAITLALEKPELKVSAVDISAEALALAQENAQQLGVADRIHFQQSDLAANVEGPFQWVIANLPYIPSGEISGLQREVQRDPLLALDGGEDGLTIIESLIESIPAKLSSDARIALEIGRGQAERVRAILDRQNYRDILIQKDYEGIERILIASSPLKYRSVANSE
jgi:release factor glutamine methyltransferase